MKQVQKIWAELSAKQVELSEEQKVELGAFEDLNAEYKAIASRAPIAKKTIMSAISDLAKVADELYTIEKRAMKIYGAAKELGATDLMSKAETLEDAASDGASSWGDIAVRLESLTKQI